MRLVEYLETHGIPVFSPRSAQFFQRDAVRLMIGLLFFLFPQARQLPNDIEEHQPETAAYYRMCMQLFADTIKGDYTRSFAIYDRKLKNDQLYREQLVEDFRDALTEGQFEVYFQPKYSIQAQEPYLYSAEALVRWKHPVLGLIGPGDFISLFEENGLIKELDCFVWDEACARIAEWKKKYGITIPVSVNVSRIDMLSSNLIEALLSILKFYELKPSDLVLEIPGEFY